MSKYSILFSIPLGFLLAVITAGSQSCQPMGYSSELKMIDSLHTWLDEANETLILDEVNIKRRYDSIQIKLDYISENKPDVTLEEQKLLTDYRAVGRAYRDYVANFEGVETEHKLHRERISNLEKDVRAGRIDKAEFKDIYTEERKLISQHRFEAKQLVSPIVSVENMYRRTHSDVRELYFELLSNRGGGLKTGQ